MQIVGLAGNAVKLMAGTSIIMDFERCAESAALLGHHQITGTLGDGYVEVAAMTFRIAGACRGRRDFATLVENESTGRKTSVGLSVRRSPRGQFRLVHQAQVKGV